MPLLLAECLTEDLVAEIKGAGRHQLAQTHALLVLNLLLLLFTRRQPRVLHASVWCLVRCQHQVLVKVQIHMHLVPVYLHQGGNGVLLKVNGRGPGAFEVAAAKRPKSLPRQRLGHGDLFHGRGRWTVCVFFTPPFALLAVFLFTANTA